MKLPSVNYLIRNAKAALLRFPLTILAAFFAMCVGIYLVEFNNDIKNIFLPINLLLTSALGIPLYFCTSIFAAKYRLNSSLKIVNTIIATILLVIVYFSLPNADVTHNTSLPYIRYGIF